MLTLWNINDDDDNVVVLVIPCEPASLGCHVVDATTNFCSLKMLILQNFVIKKRMSQTL